MPLVHGRVPTDVNMVVNVLTVGTVIFRSIAGRVLGGRSFGMVSLGALVQLDPGLFTEIRCRLDNV